LKIFIDLLKTKNDKIKEYDFGNNYDVKMENPTKNIKTGETGFIDILISDDEKAIIIENKLYNAPDTDNQLAKYFKAVSERKEVLAVVYIPLDPNKKPDMNYDDTYKRIIRIKNHLVTIPAIHKDKNDFVHGFLDRCRIFLKDKNQKAEFFFKQYINLLKHLGGDNMLEKERKELAKKLFEKEFLPITNEIMNVITDERLKYLALLFCDYFSNELKENKGYKKCSEELIWKEITEDIYLIFYHDTDGFGIGFTSNGSIPKTTDKKLKKILLNETSNNDFFPKNDREISGFSIKWFSLSNWIQSKISLEEFPIDDIKELLTPYLKGMLNSLETKARNAIPAPTAQTKMDSL